MAKGSPKDSLYSMARDIFVVTRHAGIKLLVVWKRCSEEEMVRVDLGSRGPWLLAEDFQLDFSSYLSVFARFAFTCDAMATFQNKMC